MGTITIQVVETGQTTATKTWTVPDTNIDRLVAAYQGAGNVAVGGTATRAQVLATWADTIKQMTIGYVANSEQQAAIVAVGTVSQITFT